MSIKNKNSKLQCCYNKKYGDYCGIHNKCKSIIRIDKDLNKIIKKTSNILLTSIYDIQNLKKIQKLCRNRYIANLSGPAYKNPLLCCNNRDVISLENIYNEEKNIRKLNLEFEKKLLFTFKIKKLIYGINIYSLKELFKTNNYINPFINKKFSISIIKKAKKKIEFLNLIELNLNQIKNTSIETDIKNLIMNIVKYFERFDIYILYEWLINLKRIQYIKIYNNLKTLFVNYNYSHNNLYKKIIKKNYFNINIKSLNLPQLKYSIYNIIYSILTSKKKVNIQKLTTYIILGALSNASSDIKDLYPDIIF